jgi:hypothetical protein
MERGGREKGEGGMERGVRDGEGREGWRGSEGWRGEGGIESDGGERE